MGDFLIFGDVFEFLIFRVGIPLLLRLLSPRPRIQKEGGVLAIMSGWRTTFLTLGGRTRRVVIDPKLRVIRIRDRRFWFFGSTRRIEFDWVCEVRYTYKDLLDSWWSHVEQDFYTVGLILMNGEIITLFRFFGQGDFVNNSIYPDWMRWGEFASAKVFASPDTESESQRLADVLCGLIGVKISDNL